jgi:hypothetical protein
MTSADMPFSAMQYRLPSCNLRLMTDQDAESIGKTLAVMDPWHRLGYTEAGLIGYLMRSDPSLNRYVAVVSEAIAGVVCVRYPWLRGPYIELLALFPQHQGMNMGRNIVAWISDEIKCVSGNIWSTVSSFNIPARSFYKENGFSEIVELPDLLRSGFSEILLQKKCR